MRHHCRMLKAPFRWVKAKVLINDATTTSRFHILLAYKHFRVKHITLCMSSYYNNILNLYYCGMIIALTI
jgi:hypothetical protein